MVSRMTNEALQFRGIVLPEREAKTVYVVDGRVTLDVVQDATVVVSEGWLVPGLVDAHCHVGLGGTGALDEAAQEEQALAERSAGALTLRDCGVPADTRWMDERADLPE